MTTATIPASIEDLTPAWLTRALRQRGVLGEAEVVSASATLLSEGVGFIGQVARLALTYDRNAPGAPATIIAKMPTLDPGGRRIAAMYGLYERELRFYADLARDVPLRVPRCYFSDGDAAEVRYVLLLEDMATGGRLGDQIAGCDRRDAEAAIRALAGFHAWSWNHPRLTQLPWLESGLDLVEGAVAQSYEATWPVTLAAFGDEMSSAIREAIPRLGQQGSQLLDRYREGPFTIVHGDYRADNLFFPQDGRSEGIAVLDWQSPNRGFAVYDVCYFLSGSVSHELVRSDGERLLRLYHEGLLAGGVRDYSYERCYEDYVASLLAYLTIFVINGATLDTANERGIELFRVIYRRLAEAITDTEALSLLR